MMFALVLACLVLSAAAVPPNLYVCQDGQCVPNVKGVPLLECKLNAACTAPPPSPPPPSPPPPPPLSLYTCQNNQCVLSTRGLPKVECDQICGAPPTPPNIVQLAESVPELSTLVGALKAGNLTGVLSTETAGEPFTVFAPTNNAFSALPPAVLKSLLEPADINQLRAVLLYHVVSKKGTEYRFKDLANHERITTLEGESLEVTLLDGTIFIDRSRVLKPDNLASNGVVHIIDQVLEPLILPPSPGPVPGPPSPPTGNHLYFRGFNQTGPVEFCGQVDAGPHIPLAMLNSSNSFFSGFLQEYINDTLAYSRSPGSVWPPLELGTCSQANYSRPGGCNFSHPAQWAPSDLMGGLCLTHCSCVYGLDCRDVPDNPSQRRWCSLCGPRYNSPVTVQCWMK
jgi:uncharacterized surface protein with fasciclin (FAS1) repeats